MQCSYEPHIRGHKFMIKMASMRLYTMLLVILLVLVLSEINSCNSLRCRLHCKELSRIVWECEANRINCTTYTYNSMSVERLKIPVLNAPIDFAQMPNVKKLEVRIFTGAFQSQCDFAISTHVIDINKISCVSKTSWM